MLESDSEVNLPGVSSRSLPSPPPVANGSSAQLEAGNYSIIIVSPSDAVSQNLQAVIYAVEAATGDVYRRSG